MNNIKKKNEYIVLGGITIVDISTKKFPNCSMKIDTGVWWKLLNQGIGRVSNGGNYAQTNIGRKKFDIHKLITPSFESCVDHVNHDPLDNRLSNLRDVTYAENSKNQSLSRANKSGITGIRERKGVKGSTWAAHICDGVKQLYLGSFKTKAKAIAVRKAAEVKLGFHQFHGAK